MSCDIINALKNFLKIFERKGLTWIQGKNGSVITKQFHSPVVSLDEVGAMPDETYGDILQGFIKCSKEDFLGSLLAPSNSREDRSFLLMFLHCNLILCLLFVRIYHFQNQSHSLQCQ